MKTIGFTTEYYTLWEVGEPYEVPVFWEGIKIGAHIKVDVSYCQNLSKDFQEASRKMEMTGEPFNIDLDLRGLSTFSKLLSSTVMHRDQYIAQDCFSMGRYEGVTIRTSTDLFQLFRAMADETSPRRRVHARRRLAELGALVRYRHADASGKRQSYATPEQVIRLEEDRNCGHFFKDGDQVDLLLKETRRFGFESGFGYTSVVIYKTICGQTMKYIGNNPLRSIENMVSRLEESIKVDELAMEDYDLTNEVDVKYKAKREKQLTEDKGMLKLVSNLDKDSYIPVRASIKHTVYKGVNETHLQRLKIIVPKHAVSRKPSSKVSSLKDLHIQE